MQNIKISVEKHTDGYVAYPIGIQGVVVDEGNTYKAALADVKSAIRMNNWYGESAYSGFSLA
jgi:hypothetical protein